MVRKVITVTSSYLLRRYEISSQEFVDDLSYYREHDEIIMTNGVFDILHTGHLALLRHCAELGSVVVAVNSDLSARSLGKSHPILNNETDRAEMVASIKGVVFAIIFDEPNPIEVIKIVQPDIWVKGGNYTREQLPQHEIEAVESCGGEVVISPRVKGKSNTNIWKYMEEHFTGSNPGFMEVFHDVKRDQ